MLTQTVKNIVEVIQHTAIINCDFADICAVVRNSGCMHTAMGVASGADQTDSVITSNARDAATDTNIIFRMVFDDSKGDEIKAVLIATSKYIDLELSSQ